MKVVIIKISLLFVISILSLSVSAECTFYPGQREASIQLKLPPTISIPRDATNGTIVYRTETTLASPSNSIKCTTSFFSGSISAGVSNVNGTFPIGNNTGLAWRWTRGGSSVGQYPSGTRNPAGDYDSNGETHGIELVKDSSYLSNGAKVPAGTLGYYVRDGLRVLSVAVTATEVIAQSCRSPDKIDVRMGSPTASTLFDPNNPQYISFSIRLTECPNVINAIHYRLIPAASSPAIDARVGLISLNASSTAKGVGLQLLSDYGGYYDLNGIFTVAREFRPGMPSYDIHMLAKYVRLPGVSQADIVPGTANAEIMFLINYL
ncbi:fimbrial protein [Pseudomonas sp. A34-9]|uniref:fimbrial protein n=1 Tax=Pseudomonas sp. A34-9 TaxID=3034675 RepID=UPI00240E20A3|nr:fimbrial protein [Pseudomonas sp. A34-9]